jgi:outer membrane protein assembly factor BamB
MKPVWSWISALVLVLIPLGAIGEVHFIKFNHANESGDDKNLAAIDLETGKVLWEKKLKQEVNFVRGTDDGVLVGSDDGNLYLFRKDNGSPVWTAKLGKEVNEFHKEWRDAYLVSNHQQIYWLVGRDGKIRATWK